MDKHIDVLPAENDLASINSRRQIITFLATYCAQTTLLFN